MSFSTKAHHLASILFRARAIVHCHVRDPETGAPRRDLALYREVTERIREDCVYMVHGFGQLSKGLSKAFRRGADDQQLISSYPVDPICGGTGMRCTFVKLVKGA